MRARRRAWIPAWMRGSCRGTRWRGSRAGPGFTSGHAFDTSVPGPSLAQALDAATAPGTGITSLDDDELIGVLAGWAKTEGWAAAGRLAAVAELAARRPAVDPAESGDPGRDTGRVEQVLRR